MILRIAALSLYLLSTVSTSEGAEGTFSYDDPEAWATMAIDNNQCAGSKNSPIAVADDGCTIFDDYIMNDGDCTFADMIPEITTTGVNLLYDAKSTCTKPSFKIPQKDIPEHYTGFNVHIHLSSEHTIDGEFFAAEMHMVHFRDDGNRAAVVGTMIEPDRVTDNPIFQKFLDAWSAERAIVDCSDSCSKSDVIAPTTDDMQPYKMLETKNFFHYDGGLTTPPCSEIVWWNLADTPMSISVRQFGVLSDIILNTHTIQDGKCKPLTYASKSGSTSRPVQELNGRTVHKICSTLFDEPKEKEPEKVTSDSSSLIAGGTVTAAFVAGSLFL